MSDYDLVPVLAFSIDPSVLLPYVTSTAILVIGLPVVIAGAARRARGLDKLAAFGPLLFAIGMAVFGADHFVRSSIVVNIVPKWMPLHLFWTYLVGTALLAGALSFATTIQWRLAGASFVLMILIFELTIHLPNLWALPNDKARLTLVFREMSLIAGCLAFAASTASQTHGAAQSSAGSGVLFSPLARKRFIAAACFLMGIPIGAFGIDLLIRPNLAPGIPQHNSAVTVPMPSWLPAHVLWTYLTGSIFVLAAIGLITRRYARPAALLIGAAILVMIILLYIPLTITRAGDIGGGLNPLAIHFALAGSALMLASALPPRSAARASVPEIEQEINQVA